MPGHIYVLCGEYEKAKTASQDAIRVNRKYLAYAGPHNFYTTSRCHDLHLMMYTCMFLGQFEPAKAAAEEICENLPPDVIDLKGKPYTVGTMEGYFAMKMHVFVRFGRWTGHHRCPHAGATGTLLRLDLDEPLRKGNRTRCAA